MPTVVQARPDDEIADVIDRIRSADGNEVGLVLPRGSRALHTPLNARLLSQVSRQSGKRTSIVSDEPRVQELARQNGFPVYASLPAFERGLELGGASLTPPSTYRSPATGATAAATALQDAPPRTPPPYVAPPLEPETPRGPQSLAPVAAAGAGYVGARRGGGGWRERRRPLYFAAAALVLVGLLLFFALAPSAKVTIVVAGTPLSAHPTIQGSTDPNQAKQGDHVLTSVVSASGSQSFNASPTGTETLPPAAATGQITFTTNVSSGAKFTLNQGTSFQTSDGSANFLVTQSTYICIGPQGGPPATSDDCGGEPPNGNATVQAESAGAAGNVKAGTITKWNPPSEDPCSGGNPFCAPPCNPPNGFSGCDIFVSNARATTGGADQRQVTVASATDINNWNTQITQVENSLTSQMNSQLQSKAGGKTFAVDPAGNGKAIQFAVSPQLPDVGAQFSPTKITVNVQAAAAVYDPNDVRNDLLADLTAQVSQGDEIAPGRLNAQPCQVTQADTSGTVILSCSATDYAQPIVNLQGLKARLAGKNPGDAQKIVQGSVDKVQSVSVSEFPFKLFYLPFLSGRIEIDETFVTQQPTST